MNSKLASLSRKGFTLMEMMVVLVIIGILSSALMPAINKALDSAKMTASERNMTKMFQDLVMYRTNGGALLGLARMDQNSCWLHGALKYSSTRRRTRMCISARPFLSKKSLWKRTLISLII